MKIILMQTVAGLGEAGSVKEVADGYARNFLLPQKLAVLATRGSLQQAEAQSAVSARRANKALTEAQKAAAALEGKAVTIHARVGSENRLYGSVTAADVAEALQAQYNMALDRRKIALDEAIHRTGTYLATADLGQGASARFTVEVVAETVGAHGKAARAASESEAETAVETLAVTEAPTVAEVETAAETAAETATEANPEA